jgi:hypothetical protein
LLGVAAVVAFLAFAVAQLAAGVQGIDHHLGGWWSWAALFVALALRFTLPITIGAFFGAMDVWEWHWAAAAVFAAPGLFLVLPGVLSSLASAARSWWDQRRST